LVSSLHFYYTKISLIQRQLFQNTVDSMSVVSIVIHLKYG
jgi:hypothetical protein